MCAQFVLHHLAMALSLIKTLCKYMRLPSTELDHCSIYINLVNSNGHQIFRVSSGYDLSHHPPHEKLIIRDAGDQTWDLSPSVCHIVTHVWCCNHILLGPAAALRLPQAVTFRVPVHLRTLSAGARVCSNLGTFACQTDVLPLLNDLSPTAWLPTFCALTTYIKSFHSSNPAT